MCLEEADILQKSIYLCAGYSGTTLEYGTLTTILCRIRIVARTMISLFPSLVLVV